MLLFWAAEQILTHSLLLKSEKKAKLKNIYPRIKIFIHGIFLKNQQN